MLLNEHQPSFVGDRVAFPDQSIAQAGGAAVGARQKEWQMIDDDVLVADGVIHGFDVSQGNRAARCSPEEFSGFQRFMHQIAHVSVESSAPGYQLSLDEFTTRCSADALAHTLFVESDVDIAFYHHVPIAGFFENGVSRLDTGLELREIAPGRVFVYGGVDTFVRDRGKVFAQMEELAEQGVVGFKFYPSNGIVDEESRALMAMTYDDPEVAFPIFEKARELGIKHLAFHKAYPMGPSVKAVDPSDILPAAVAFPDLTFEIVHAGWAFLEETALELMLHPNIYANLEASANLVVVQPRRFAHMLGFLLRQAGPDRILYGSGCCLTHADPPVQDFWSFEMPEDLMAGYGYPEVTPEMKRAMLGGNMTKLHDLDVDKIKNQCRDDIWAKRRNAGKQEPWTTRRSEMGAAR
jgi:hypothetical protein